MKSYNLTFGGNMMLTENGEYRKSEDVKRLEDLCRELVKRVKFISSSWSTKSKSILEAIEKEII